MSQPDEFLDRIPEPPEPSPDRTCPECDGTGICDYVDDGGTDTCDTCHGTGQYVPRERTYAEIRERVRFERRLLNEPMYGEAVLFLVHTQR